MHDNSALYFRCVIHAECTQTQQYSQHRLFLCQHVIKAITAELSAPKLQIACTFTASLVALHVIILCGNIILIVDILNHTLARIMFINNTQNLRHGKIGFRCFGLDLNFIELQECL